MADTRKMGLERMNSQVKLPSLSDTPCLTGRIYIRPTLMRRQDSRGIAGVLCFNSKSKSTLIRNWTRKPSGVPCSAHMSRSNLEDLRFRTMFCKSSSSVSV